MLRAAALIRGGVDENKIRIASTCFKAVIEEYSGVNKKDLVQVTLNNFPSNLHQKVIGSILCKIKDLDVKKEVIVVAVNSVFTKHRANMASYCVRSFEYDSERKDLLEAIIKSVPAAGQLEIVKNCSELVLSDYDAINICIKSVASENMVETAAILFEVFSHDKEQDFKSKIRHIMKASPVEEQVKVARAMFDKVENFRIKFELISEDIIQGAAVSNQVEIAGLCLSKVSLEKNNTTEERIQISRDCVSVAEDEVKADVAAVCIEKTRKDSQPKALYSFIDFNDVTNGKYILIKCFAKMENDVIGHAINELAKFGTKDRVVALLTRTVEEMLNTNNIQSLDLIRKIKDSNVEKCNIEDIYNKVSENIVGLSEGADLILQNAFGMLSEEETAESLSSLGDELSFGGLPEGFVQAFIPEDSQEESGANVASKSGGPVIGGSTHF